MKVLYISYDGMTDPLGQSQVIPYLIGLVEKGNKISIISCEKSERFEKQKELIKQLLLKAKIEWFPVIYSSLPSVLSKKFNLLKIQYQANKIFRSNKPNIVHCRSYMAALIGLKLKHRYNVKFIFDMRGFWADERVDGEIWNLENKLHKNIYAFFKKKEIEFLNHADYTICLTNNAKKEILSWKQITNKKLKIEVIPCCADLNLFSPKNVKPYQLVELQKSLLIDKNDFIISYLGSIGTWYMLDEMLDFFSCLVKVKPESKFLFITPDDKTEVIKRAAFKGIKSEKIIVVSSGRADVPLYLSLSKISIYFIKPVYSKKASSPTKTAEIMALGIPIITNKGIGDSDEIITDSKAGLLINDFNNFEYNNAIDQIDVILSSDKTKIIKAAHHYFSLEKGIELYEKVYKKLK